MEDNMNNGTFSGADQNQNSYQQSNNYQQTPNGYYQQPVYGEIPGKGQATASLVLGIISIVSWIFVVSSFLSVICGIIGIVCANKSKKLGYKDGVRTGGFVTSLIGLIGGALILIFVVLGILLAAAFIAEFGFNMSDFYRYIY